MPRRSAPGPSREDIAGATTPWPSRSHRPTGCFNRSTRKLNPVRARDTEILHEILETRERFGHREHLELAWRYLNLYPLAEAGDAMAASIRHVARLHGAEDKYHETITRAWLHFVAVHRQRWGADSFDGFLHRNPDLLDGRLVEHYYSRDLIQSEHARSTFSAPDVHPLPALA